MNAKEAFGVQWSILTERLGEGYIFNGLRAESRIFIGRRVEWGIPCGRHQEQR